MVLGFLAFGVMVSATLGAKPKNVLFIISDDLNCNMGAYGHPLVKTPHLDQLARDGMLFQNAFTNFPVCGQSRSSFLTGLYPEQNGVVYLRQLIRDHVPDVVTMPQHFQQQGYTSVRVGKLYHYDNPLGVGTNGHDDPASWDVRVSPIGRDRFEEDKIWSVTPGRFGASMSWHAAEGTDDEQTDGMVAKESIRALEYFAETGKPFFLGVGFYRPHTPFVAPKKYFDLYDPSEIEVPRVPTGYLDTLPAPAAKSIRSRKHEIDLPEDIIRKSIHAYYASISFMDAQVGRVLAALDELGLRDDTVILFTSDHGYHMGEHGYFQKTTLFEHADRVPLIVSTPDMKTRGQSTDAMVEMVDFYRTLSELAGASAPRAYIQGESFAEVLAQPETSPRPDAITQLVNGYSLRTPRYRFTRWTDTPGLNVELYDRLSDPAEMRNLAHDPVYADVQAQLSQRLNQRIEEITTKVDGLRFVPADPKFRGYHRDKLKELGLAGEPQAEWAPPTAR
ncbi:MAG: sulfatase [Synoicihabitans sp.]